MNDKVVNLIGFPIDLGADRRGVDMGPSALRIAVLQTKLERLGYKVISFDLDSVDPEIAPGVGTPVRGGFSYREAHLLMESIAECGCMSSLEIAEINPILDTRNRSAEFAAELVASSMGQRIL